MNNQHLEGLILKWREIVETKPIGSDYLDGIAFAHKRCADELEVALAALPGGGVDEWEPLTTADAVAAALAAGRRVEFTSWLEDDYQLPASNKPESGGWIRIDRCERDDAALLSKGCRFRALISPAPNPHEDGRNG